MTTTQADDQQQQNDSVSTALIKAREVRNQRIEDAREAFARSSAEANKDFMHVVRTSGLSVTAVSKTVDIGRQQLHELLRRHPA